MSSSATYDRVATPATRPRPATPMPLIPDGTWTVDAARSEIGFAARELRLITVRGRFGDVSGTLRGGRVAWPIAECAVRVASIDTGTPKRDDHLRSSDFFDADAHPEMKLVADWAEPQPDGTYRVPADLTIRGNTRPVRLTVDEHELTGDRLRLRATGRIHRYDFGVRAPQKVVEAGGFLIGREVDLELRIEAVRD